ncbi:MAG: HDIG domain-containing protein [Spirochaetia bacterium]|jgi:putative nucleotidyltransferase with HDIG domain|nr:HDIG domain-containing protein [Spirochaetia bacterium]
MKFIGNIIGQLSSVFAEKKNLWCLGSVFLLILLSTVLLALNNTGKTYRYNVGDIALEEVRAPQDIHFIKEAETDRLRERVAASSPIVFDRDTAVLTERLQMVDSVFRNVAATRAQHPPMDNDDMMYQLMTLKKRLPYHVNDSVLLFFLSYGAGDELKRIISRIVIHIYDNKEVNITESAYNNPLNLDNRNITVRLINSSVESDEISGNIDNLYPVDEMQKKVYGICRSIAPDMPAKALNSIALFINGMLKPDTFFNEEETKKRLAEADSTVKPVMGLLKKGQTVLREGDTVTLEAIDRINVLNKLAEKSNITYVAGVFLIQFIFLCIFVFFIASGGIVIPDKKFSVIIFSLLSVFLVYAFFIVTANTTAAFALLLPIPLITMVLSILYSPVLATIMGFHVVFFTFMIHDDFNTVILAFTSALLGVFVNLKVQKRTDFLLGGLYIGLVNSVVVIAITLMQETQLYLCLKNVQIAIGSGIINSVLALGLFPFYESAFGVTTKFKLLELSDLNSDIFRKMLMKAPGTYHHSLIVSNMAEAACRNIKADPILARVGAFYHDIGKIENAGIYIENKVTDPLASKLSPSDYSKLIISHVETGVAIAKEQRLPESVIDFIREHHGNTTMTYFYHKALESVTDEESNVHKSDFQYPGPKPQTKESAVVMLADSIEAASRSIQDPTHAKLRGTVRKIIYNKLNEGEFENTDLSMADLSSIENSFLVILSGIYHTRLEYPESADIERLEKKLKKNESANESAD